MDISIFKKSTTNMEQLDVETAFNLWNLMRARYESVEAIQMLMNFVHDRDFDILLGTLLKHFQTQSEQLEKEGKKFRLKVPTRPPIDIKTSTHVDEITDKFIYKRIYADLLAEMNSLNSAVRTSLTNDRLRDLFKKFLLSHVHDFELLYKYGKIKGWEEVAPAYKIAKQIGREQLSVSEAYHLWHHINDRYIQSQLTQFFLGFVHDVEFQAILNLGVNILKKQIEMLEQLALKYEVQLPERPPASLQVPIDPESLEDRFMYQIVYKGIDDSIEVHIRAVIETLRNDSLRQIFLDLYEAELGIQDKILKYGKMKGWARVPPVYVEPT